ncbi:MAG TPA: hypothetical protein G4O18_05285 [Dehalococcoidia bacterium]|nr:hypothetical protein [Dehalococcoidia bacterium]
MNAKRANELTVLSLSAKTIADLEDAVNDWLKEQNNRAIVHDISFEYSSRRLIEYTAWVVYSHES